jgi:hypothetical protein
MPCVSIAGWWCDGWGVFSGHTLGPLIKVEQHLNTTGYLYIIANQVHPFMAAVYPSANLFFQQYYAPRLVHGRFHEHK